MEKNATDDGYINVDPSFRGSVFIPITQFNSSGDFIYTYAYHSSILFVNQKRIKSGTNNSGNVDSFVVAVSIGTKKSVSLSQPIRLELATKDKRQGERSCVFWSFKGLNFLYFYFTLAAIHKVRTHRTWTVHCRGYLSEPVRIKSARAPTGSLGSRQNEPGN